VGSASHEFLIAASGSLYNPESLPRLDSRPAKPFAFQRRGTPGIFGGESPCRDGYNPPP